MSFTFVVITMLLGSSVVIAFVLQPSKEEPAASANAPVSYHRSVSFNTVTFKTIFLKIFQRIMKCLFRSETCQTDYISRDMCMLRPFYLGSGEILNYVTDSGSL